MIDWDRITELKTEILCEDFSEVFSLFLEEVEEVLSRLKTAPNRNAFEAEFHLLKGGAVNVGFSHCGYLFCAA